MSRGGGFKGYNLYKDASDADWEFWFSEESGSQWKSIVGGDVDFNKPVIFSTPAGLAL